MKENKDIMNEKIEKIGISAIECLNGRDFSKLILGLIIKKTDESIIKNMELFYKNTDNKICYFNELIYNDEFNDIIEEQKYLQLQNLLFDLYNYCAECGDEWKYMTLLINADGSFSIDFKYEPIEIINWRKNNGIIN